MIALIHTILGFAALIAGFVVLFRPKGTRFHILFGRVFVGSMVGLNLSAFGIFNLFGGWGAFHWMAIFSLLTVLAGLYVILMKRKFKRAITMHYYFMVWAYLGLLAATSNEVFVNVPFLNNLEDQYPSLPLISIGLIIVAGMIFVPLLEKKTVRKIGLSRTS